VLDDTFDVSEKQSDLLRFIERIERLLEEKKGIMDDVKDVKAEAKATGLDPAIMMKIIALRKMEPGARQELDALMETYRNAVGLA
jgi:uncharacterized protein (UPF0335 family)